MANSEEESLQGTAISFNIYQGSVQMGSIFLGFVFAGLVQLLTCDRPLLGYLKTAVVTASCAVLFLSLGLVCFHVTSNQIINKLRIFYPNSPTKNLGGTTFTIGIWLMLSTLSCLLAHNHFLKTAGFVFAASIGIGIFGFLGCGKLHHGQEYVVNVGRAARLSSDVSSGVEKVEKHAG